MWTTLVVFLCFGATVHAASIRNDRSISPPTTAARIDNENVSENATTTPYSSFDVDAELEKLETFCLTPEENKQLSGERYKFQLTHSLTITLLQEAQSLIGLEEMRNVLGFGPLGPWTNFSHPREEDIAAAPTIEAYYELTEPRSDETSLDSWFFYEENIREAIAFLEKRKPQIRTIYRQAFEEFRRRPDAPVTIDRKEVDLMIKMYTTIVDRISKKFLGSIKCRIIELNLRDKKENTGNPE